MKIRLMKIRLNVRTVRGLEFLANLAEADIACMTKDDCPDQVPDARRALVWIRQQGDRYRARAAQKKEDR